MAIAIRPPTIGKARLHRAAAPLAPSMTVTPREEVDTVLDEDAQMIQAVKKGFLVGTPAVFVIASGMALVAGATAGIAAMIGAWSGLIGGWYFGSIFFLNSKPSASSVRTHARRGDHRGRRWSASRKTSHVQPVDPTM